MTTPDDIRTLALDRMLLLPGHEPQGTTQVDPVELPPAERDRAFNIAQRRLAFQLLFELDQSAPRDPEAWIRTTLADVQDLGPLALEWIVGSVTGAFAAREAADAEFRDLAPDWPTHRQAAVDRAILRLAHFELTRAQLPGRIIVSEAVELAKHFSTEKSPAFINGLLDRVFRRISPDQAAEQPATGA